MTTDRNNSVHYRYRLTEDAPDTEIMLEKTVLRKDTWVSSFNKMLKFDPYLRGTHNPNGFVEYQEYIPATGKVLHSNLAKEQAKKKEEIKEDDLKTLSREQLEKEAEIYNITVLGKTDDELIKYIQQARKRKNNPEQKKRERNAVIETEFKN